MSTNSLNNDPEGTIPVDQAIQLTSNWRVYLATAAPDFIAQSFLIPIINFKNILQYNPDAESVRAYLALEDPTDPTTAQLLLVPVSGGQDVVYLPKANSSGDGSVEDSPSNIYDFTTVCPPMCPPPGGSPLSK